jgi:hypothetical protein
MIYSEHALEMMNERAIGQDDVERTVAPLYFVGYGNFGRRVYVRRYGQYGMRFVVVCSPDGNTVISVRKQSRPFMGV